MAGQTLRTTDTNQNFVDVFEGRLQALARSHNLLVEARWEGTDFEALVRSHLEAYLGDGPQRLNLHGDPVILSPDFATPFGLVLHELATNAAKYGAFSVATGRVVLTWTIDTKNDKRLLKVIWREIGGPPVSAPTRKGFGGSLIERGLPGCHVKREFAPEGLTCTLEIELPKEQDHGIEDRRIED